MYAIPEINCIPINLKITENYTKKAKKIEVKTRIHIHLHSSTDLIDVYRLEVKREFSMKRWSTKSLSLSLKWLSITFTNCLFSFKSALSKNNVLTVLVKILLQLLFLVSLTRACVHHFHLGSNYINKAIEVFYSKTFTDFLFVHILIRKSNSSLFSK